MTKTPYLHRRGNNFYFRVTVPSQLRPFIGCREIVKTLKTQNHNEAVPLALSLGSKAKTLFNKVRVMTDKNEIDALLALISLDALDDSKDDDFRRSLTESDPLLDNMSIHQRALLWRRDFKHSQQTDRLQDKIIEQRLRHIADMKHHGELSSENEKATREAMATLSASTVIVPDKKSPMLSYAIDGYIGRYERQGRKAMLQKVKSVLPILLEVIGDKPAHTIKQQAISDFFELVQGLPPRWKDIKNKNPNEKYINIIKQNTGDGMAEKTLFDTYRAVVRLFLKSAYNHLKDQNFPLLTTEGDVVIYAGDSPTGLNKQRSLKHHELQTLFEGSLMQEFANDKNKAHQYWLPHLGLFTGARINELCQINPQTDIEEINGVWCFKMSIATAGDPRITKRLKNKNSARNVPIHSKLIELGFLDYFKSVKKRNSMLLFPAWKPSQDRAASNAIKWFSRHLDTTGLRDDTKKAKITGFHAFRHTFITKGANLRLRVEVRQITGHGDDDDNATSDGYIDIEGIDMNTAQSIVEQFNFDLNFIKPVKPL